VIRVRGLSKRYPSGTVGLDGVSLDVAAGEFVALIGSSGAGKSTLLRCLNGLVIPTAGTVSVDDQPVTGASPAALRSVRAHVGFVFQQFNLLKRLSVLDNVLVGSLARVDRWRSLLARFPAAEVERARRTLRRVGLEGVEAQRADTLSGGQQQRVAIARALVSRPTVVFADEPTGNLDSKTGVEILELMRRSVDEYGQSTVMVTHDPRAAAIADRILFLADGRIVKDIGKASAHEVVVAMEELDRA